MKTITTSGFKVRTLSVAIRDGTGDPFRDGSGEPRSRRTEPRSAKDRGTTAIGGGVLACGTDMAMRME